MINEDRMLKTLTFVNVHKHIKALFIMIIKWLGIIDDTLEKKADLIGGKVPAEQLPSYVDDVIDITTFVTKTELVNNIGKANYTNKNFIVNSPTSDSLYNKIVITNANTSQNDWEIIDPEDGKIYINEANNHSYRWSGNSFVDLDKNFNDRLNVIENKLSIINNVLYFTTNTNEARLAQIQKYNLKNKKNQLFSSVYNINNVIYYGICTLYSDTEMSLTSFRKYSVITNIISLDTGEVITDFIMSLQEIFNYQSYKVLGGNKININDWYSALINSIYPTSIIVKEDNITNAVDDSTANKISISGKIIYEPTDNKIIEFSRGEETEDAIYFISNYSADQYKQLKYNKSTKKFDAVSINNYTGSSSSISDLFIDITGKFGNITNELHNQIINAPAIIFNNAIYFKTSTVDGIKIHFINYEENGDLSELIYTIASKSFTTNSVSNTIINKEISIDKTMNNITPTDIFTTSLLQTINIVENANRLNIIVKDNSSIKQTLTILNVSKTLQNGDLRTANYSITCAFNGIIYYGNVKNNVYNIIAYKTFYSLLYR